MVRPNPLLPEALTIQQHAHSHSCTCPAATGLASSPILGGQAALWTKIGGVCGSGFLTSITQQAGSTITSGAGRSTAAATGVSLLSLGAAAFAFLL